MSDTPSARPLLDKVGIKPNHLVVLLGIDASFVTLVASRASLVSTDRARNADVIFIGAHKLADLSKIASVKADLAKDGALWVVRPKGRNATGPSEAQTMRAGLDAGLVDVKVVAFSESHSALKFVYRVADR